MAAGYQQYDASCAAAPAAPAAAAGNRYSHPGGLGWLAGLAIFILMAFSPIALDMMGLHYEQAGGSPLEKFHPSSLLLILSFLAAFLLRPRPLELAGHIFTAHKLSLIFLMGLGLLLFQVVIIQHQPFSPVLDRFLPPVLLLFLITLLSAHSRRRLARLVHLLMALNALLALIEIASGWRLEPLVINGLQIDDWRVTALLGHPLSNAVVTGFYLIVLALGGGRDLPRWGRSMAFGINLLAMVAFGGRASTVLLIPFLLGIGFIRALPVMNGARISRHGWLLTVLLATIGSALVITAFEAGLFDLFISRFLDDKGSASARVIMFDLFSNLSWLDIWIGPDPDYLASLLRQYGLAFGIESFWVAFVLSYGLLVSGLFFIGFFAFLGDIVRHSSPRAILPLIYYLLVASTSVSLSAKGTDFGIVIAMALLMLSPRPETSFASNHEVRHHGL